MQLPIFSFNLRILVGRWRTPPNIIHGRSHFPCKNILTARKETSFPLAKRAMPAEVTWDEKYSGNSITHLLHLHRMFLHCKIAYLKQQCWLSALLTSGYWRICVQHTRDPGLFWRSGFDPCINSLVDDQRPGKAFDFYLGPTKLRSYENF